MKKSKSVLKRIRQNERRRVRNRANTSRYKTAIKKLETAIAENDAERARSMLPTVIKAIDTAVSHDALTMNSASRKKSSLTKRVNALA